MATILNDVTGLREFDCSDATGISARWMRWLRSFELFVVGKGISKPDQKRALLLHSAGLEVQDIFFTLEEEDDENVDVYENAKNTLCNHFKPQANIPFERHGFRSMSQKPNETVEQFITRLKQKAETCSFSDTDEQIRDQVIEKCLSSHLRRKLLEKGGTLTLLQLRGIARSMEATEHQVREIEKVTCDVNKLSIGKPKPTRTRQETKAEITCYSCGYSGHRAKDEKCPARNKKCNNCQNIGHFGKMCKTKPNKHKKNGKYVRQVVEPEVETGFAFSIRDGHNTGTISILVGGVSMNVMIDSGASVNVIDRNQWEVLKRNNVDCVSSKENRTLYAYGSEEPLPVAGVFKTQVQYEQQKVDNVEFVVIEGKGQALLGKQTAMRLNVLTLGPTINAVDTNIDRYSAKYPKLFEGVGKLKDFQLTIPIDTDHPGVIQPLRRVPFHLRDKLGEKLDQLEQRDIIEKVDKPSKWVSPVVCVPKEDDIRLCVDMRQANTAVKRVRHPIPTVDEVLQDFNQSTVFSKVDIKWAYHQVELEPESREITTFCTHKGLYRYKRLLFGVSCAPEMYQRVLQQLLQGCEGVENMFDDIIVHGATEREHDERLDCLMKVLSESGLTLNKAKCKLNMSKLIFMGHVLSAKGIGPADVKVKAVADAREPETSAEVRSFLGLVTYTSRFIPNLATVSEPLRKLTKKDEPFVWGPEQQKSFDALKESLSNAETLGYFDLNAPTQVIADASPVGLGAVLVQKQNGEYRPITYASKSLSSTERRYSQTEKEALALVWACERFHAYIYGVEFELITDHKPLECIYTPRSKPCARIERWVLRMQPYQYKVKYIPGKKNIADVLSRLSVTTDVKVEKSNIADEYVRFVAMEATPSALTTRKIEEASYEDAELQQVRDCLLQGKWHTMKSTGYLPVQNELTAIGHLVLRGTRIVIPKALREHVLNLAHEGHPGIVSMKRQLRTKVWWPGIDKDAENFCKSCYGCQLVGQSSKPEPMTRTELPSAPWQYLAADLLGPLPSGDYIFVEKEKGRVYAVERPEPFTVIQKENNSVLVESQDGVKYKRNVTHVKPLIERDQDHSYERDTASNEVNEQELEVTFPEVPNPMVPPSPLAKEPDRSRPARTRNEPRRFNDFVKY